MDKRKEENLRVKKSITAALFSLVQEKQLADIHITEIIRKAGVARVSFYRNYCSKEDIVVTLIRDILQAVLILVFRRHVESGMWLDEGQI